MQLDIIGFNTLELLIQSNTSFPYIRILHTATQPPNCCEASCFSWMILISCSACRWLSISCCGILSCLQTSAGFPQSLLLRCFHISIWVGSQFLFKKDNPIPETCVSVGQILKGSVSMVGRQQGKLVLFA